MLRFVDQALGVPLDGGEQWERGILEGFNDAVGGGGDHTQAAAEAVGGLLVIAVDRNLRLADGLAQMRSRVECHGVAGELVAEFAVLIGELRATSGRNWCMLPPR